MAGVTILYVVELATPQRDFFVGRSGEIENDVSVLTLADASVHENVVLQSTTGLEVALRVKRPAAPSAARIPVFLIVGGHRTGKDAVDLIGDRDDAAFAAIDYPYHGSRSLDGFWDYAAATPAFQRAMLDTPPSLSLAVDWLLRQQWVDHGRIELLGVSLGVPFAAVGGALDKRVSRVWLVHGGADNLSWVMHAGRHAIENETLRRYAARTLLLLVYGHSFDTGSWIREIAPRPLVIVAARDDERVPEQARQPFIDAAGEPWVELVWTSGLHVDPRRPQIIEELLNIVFERALAAHDI